MWDGPLTANWRERMTCLQRMTPKSPDISGFQPLPYARVCTRTWPLEIFVRLQTPGRSGHQGAPQGAGRYWRGFGGQVGTISKAHLRGIVQAPARAGRYPDH